MAEKVARDPEKLAVYSLTMEEAFLRSSVVSQVKYTLYLEIPRGDTYSGHLEVEFLLSDHQVPLWLDFKAEEVHQLVVNGASFNVNNELSVEGSDLNVEWRHSKLHLAGLKAGANTVKVAFKNNYAKDGCGLHHFVDPEDSQEYLYSQFEPHYAQRMFPCFDQPDIKAVLALTLKAPEDWRVISNTTAESAQANEEGFVTTVFKPTARISTYLYAVCAGPYTEFRVDENEVGVPLGFYCRKTLAPYFVLERYSHPTIVGFAFYNEFFDFPYPFEKYDQVFCPEFNAGAMENVGCVTYRDQYVFRDPPSRTELLRVTLTMLHEMAHMWFGDLVTMKWWDDLWLNESFADYICYYAVSKSLEDKYPEIWQAFLERKGWGYATDQLPTTHPISLKVPGTADVETIFDGISYSKGASVLKQLSFVVGEESFRTGLRKYMHKYQFANATFSDLIGILDQEVELDLVAWADIWVKTAGLNQVEPVVIAAEGRVQVFEVLQTPALADHATLRPHKIIAEVYDADLNLTSSLTVQVEAQSRTVVPELAESPEPAFVLLNGGDKDFVKALIAPASLSVLKEKLVKILDPLSRQLIYRALWDMVRDLKISGAEFVDLVSSHLGNESSLYNTTYTLNILSAALQYYVPEGPHKDIFYQRIFSAILAKIRDSTETHTVVQLQKYIFSYVEHSEDLETVVHWLISRDTGVAGLHLSQGDRWKILKLLSVKDVERSRELIQVELAADQSDTGKLSHLYCLSALPIAETKAEWWHKFASGDATKLSRYERETVMSGFVQKSQKELLAQYAQEYFASVLSIISKYDQEYSLDFAFQLFPDFADDDFLIEKTESVVVPEGYSRIHRYYTDRVDLLKKYKVGKQLSEEYLARLHH